MKCTHDEPIGASGHFNAGKKALKRHIAWDIGIAAVSRFVADALDATLVQRLRCSQLRDVGDGRS